MQRRANHDPDYEYEMDTPADHRGMAPQHHRMHQDSDYEYGMDSPDEPQQMPGQVKQKKQKKYSGLPKQKWTDHEEEALKAGVQKYGVGKWRLIQKDEEFGPMLSNRSNVDLKDKWRNLTMDSKKNKERAVAAAAAAGGMPHHPVMDADDDDYLNEGRPKRKKRAVGSGRTPHGGLEQLSQVGSSMAAQEDANALSRAMYAAATANQMAGMSDPAMLAQMGVAPPAETSQMTGTPDDMVVAAIISLQVPEGSTPEDITHWIESHYGMTAGFRNQVRETLRRMVDAGRLEVSDAGGVELYRLGGVVRKLNEEGAAGGWAGAEGSAAGHEGTQAHDGDRSALEAAEVAARAVAEAEEAAALASRLMDAANRYEQAAQASTDMYGNPPPEGQYGSVKQEGTGASHA